MKIIEGFGEENYYITLKSEYHITIWQNIQKIPSRKILRPGEIIFII